MEPPQPPNIFPSRKFLLKVYNVATYQEYLNLTLQSPWISDISRNTETLTHSIQQAPHKASLQRVPSTGRQQQPVWWDISCQAKFSQLCKLYVQYRKTLTLTSN